MSESPVAKDSPYIDTLALREGYRTWYIENRDPIAEDRMLWRAQTFRHIVHLLPGQTILELGCGDGHFTRALHRISRGENPITAITFEAQRSELQKLPPSVEYLTLAEFSGQVESRKFDFIAAMDLLDQRNSAWFLQKIYKLLKPGGEVVLYESNPWNPVHKVRRLISTWLGHPDPRRLLSQLQLYELMSEIGFVRSFAVFNDFVYAPLTPRLVWLFRNLSIVMENAPIVRRFAGAIVVHSQKPPRRVAKPRLSLADKETLQGSVSVVIPCHNEEMNIRQIVDGLRCFYDAYIREIILVDDNSTDKTRQVIETLAEEDPRVRPLYRTGPNGVGRTLSDGYRIATGTYILSMDCDFQHLLPELRDMFDAAANGFDVVVGSRFSRHSVLLNYPAMKIVANRGFHAIAQLLLLRRFRDLTNNLKLMRRDVVEKLHLMEPGFAVNAETGLQPLMMGYNIKEVPISWINRMPDMGSSSFKLVRVGGGYWRVLLYSWLRCALAIGPYRKLDTGGNARNTFREWGTSEMMSFRTNKVRIER
jgi:dolichol-phosphate mannosyltransferase